MSDHEAAVKIQSSYRGYKVRIEGFSQREKKTIEASPTLEANMEDELRLADALDAELFAGAVLGGDGYDLLVKYITSVQVRASL